MKILTAIITLAALVCSVNALLTCWECRNARSNRECRLNGQLRRCQPNEKACQTEVRRDPHGIRISKMCKQARACDNNFVQNPRSAWYPSQCSDIHGSVCRCCCDFDNCNTPSIACASRPEPTCERLPSPENGDVSCYGNASVPVGEQCFFECSIGFTMTGNPTLTCQLTSPTTAAYDQPAPACISPQRDEILCQPELEDPEFG
uniref:Sushi domain-containing protein n=3 Tax=Ciona intestinalis TaxID=7719 RepID=F6VLE7_CIOIN